MHMRRLAAALVGSCAVFSPVPTLAQASRATLPPAVTEARIVRTASPTTNDPRLTPMPEWRERELMPGGMLQSWRQENVEIGLGRFRVTEARRRTNLETERNPAALERESRAIAGAGMRIRFR